MPTEEDIAAAKLLRKKEKKKAKKAKKKALALEAASETGSKKRKPEAESAAPSSAEKKKKKKRKREKKAASAATGAAAAPAAGNFKTTSSGIRKDFYVEHPDVTARSAKQVAAYREERDISVTGDDVEGAFGSIEQFTEASLSLPRALLKVTDQFETPSPVQSSCWPPVLSGRDVIGIAATGSGKTLAFALPGLLHTSTRLKAAAASGGESKSSGGGGRGKRGNGNGNGNGNGLSGPVMLVVAPTRELAVQCATVCSDAGRPFGVESVCIYGGVPKGPQKGALRKGVSVVVCTPGRLLDLNQEGCLDLSSISYLVLDEADRMLDMGFERDIRAIISKTHPQRQTLMFSATWPERIQKIAAEFLTQPVMVSIGSKELSANHRVSQLVEVMEPRARERRLQQLLQDYHGTRKNRVLVFVLYKKEAARVEQNLKYSGWNVAAIHGDKGQAERQRALDSFRSGEVPLLVATDVAARGLDIPNVTHVINFTFPLTTEDYVHRIGRTGRGGSTGVSHTLFTVNDKSRAGELANVLREAGQTVPEELLQWGTHVKKKEHGMYGAFGKRRGGAITKKSSHVKF